SNNLTLINSSAHSPIEWTTQYVMPQTLQGIWYIAFASVCQILYIPSLRVFYRERRLTCYKIMFLLAIADMSGLMSLGSLFGCAMVNGLVFCSDVTLGCGALGESKGRPSSVCMLLTIFYGAFIMLFTRPYFANSVHQTSVFDPFIPGHSSNK
ncbi:hypothetical protein PENTCL1PPCAC_16464, partial [Pristionchus entomophagus]